jgi:hypothetical protein
VVADHPANFGTGDLYAVFGYSATGTRVTTQPLMGNPSGTCADWTSTTGSNNWVTQAHVNMTSKAWNWYGGNTSCADTTQRLVCAQRDYQTRPVLPSPTGAGKRAFVSQSVALQSGVAGFDAQCASEAQAAGLAGTFLALVSTTSVAGATRLASGVNYVRIDGALIGTKENFTSIPPALSAGIDRYADGTKPEYNLVVATGADISQPSTNFSTCNNWTTNAVNESLQGGYLGAANYDALWVVTTWCSYAASVYCVQQ